MLNSRSLHRNPSSVSPRTYDNTLRKEMEADTIRRIVAATVELHARQGALATTHAEIAALAGVSVATVYKHFPSREALVPHCTGMVMAQAPQVDMQALLATRDRHTLLGRLVAALHAQYRFMDPWMRWTPSDAASLPALAQIVDAQRHALESMVRDALASTAGPPVDDDTFACVMVLLDYSAWQRLTQVLADPDRVRRATEQALPRLMTTPPQHKGGSEHGDHATTAHHGG